EGTDEIGLSVMATTFAIVAVFVPIAFMKGIMGQFFFQFGLTVAVAVLVSLFVSFTLDPMLSSVWHDPPRSRFSRVPWLGSFMDGVERVIEWIHRFYGQILAWALAHRVKVILIALVSFGASCRAVRPELKAVSDMEVSFGFDRAVWVHLLGPDPATVTTLIKVLARKVGQGPGIADVEASEKDANPPLWTRLNTDAACDHGISVQ